MSRNRNYRVMCILIACLLPVLAETTKKSTFAASSPTSSTTGSSSGRNKNNILKDIDREQDVGQKWKKMEASTKKVFSILYNETFPFVSHMCDTLDLSRNCKRDLMKILTGINQFKYWAVQMLDSFGMLPAGIERGSISALGDYDQCLEVDVPGYFKGQYCNLDLIVPLPKREHFVRMDVEMPEVMKMLQPDGFFTFFGKYGRFFNLVQPRLAICVPSTCSREEVQKIANEAVKTMDIPLKLHVPDCEVADTKIKFDRVEITVMFILGILLLLVISSTVVDVYLKIICNEDGKINNDISLLTKYLLCFSIYTNTKNLLKPDNDKDSIKIFHGIRFFTTLWVIALHVAFYQVFQANSGNLNMFKSVGRIPFQFLCNGFFNVQIFFSMSSTLHSLRVMKMKEKMNIKKHIFRRMWRLVPAFMLVICCVILLPHLGSGPVWKRTVRDGLAEKCRARWWTNLLFINNLIRNDDMCLQWLWYIPTDFQLYVLSLLVLIPLKSNPIRAFSVNILILFGATIIYAVCHVYYNLTPMLIASFTDPEDISYFLERGYYRPYLHCSSICIGLAVGYFLSKRPPKLHIPLKLNLTLWLASATIWLLVIFGVCRWSEGNIPGIVVSTLYAILSKILCSAAIAWVTIACSTGNGGFVAKFLSLPIFVPLGRLCYMTYLLHPIIHFMYVGSTRLVIRVDERTLVYTYFANVLISFICAAILTLIFESPFMALDKLVFSEKTPKRTKRLTTLDNGKPGEVSTKAEDTGEDTNRHQKLS